MEINKIKYTNINNEIAKEKDDYLEWQIKIKNQKRLKIT